MARKNQCLSYAQINGEISTLYADLSKLIKNRALTNYIYASYLQQGVDAQMDSMGFKRNEQGQHNAKDVFKFFDVATLKIESTPGKVFEASLYYGAIDSSGNYIPYTNAEQALNIAQQINTDKKGLAAFVTQVGNEFNVVVGERNSKTIRSVPDIDKKLQIWDITKQVFNAAGIDITAPSIDSSLINALNCEGFIRYLDRLKNVSNDLIPQNEIKFLLQLNSNTTQVQRLVQIFGTIDDAAAGVYNALRNPNTVTSGQYALINSTITNIKQLSNVDMQGLLNQIDTINNTMQTTKEVSIADEIQRLHQQYNINLDEIHLVENEITSLKEAAAQAASTLKKEYNKINMEKGMFAPESIAISKVVDSSMQSINSGHYYSSLLDFLSFACTRIEDLENRIVNTPSYSNPIEKAAAMSKTLMEVSKVKAGYLHILEALSDIDSLVSSENLTANEKQTIQNEATKIKKFFNKYERLLKSLRQNNMIDIATTVLGDTLANGTAVADIVLMAEADSSIYDHLYSMARVSNPLIGSMGAIIRDEQKERDKKLNRITREIAKATHRLKAAGHNNTRFMYEPDGYIISDIDWRSFNVAKVRYSNDLFRRGYRGNRYSEAMRGWLDMNTEYKVVDNVSGREERIPNASYGKAFPNLTAAQLEYYNTMMQLKAELASVLPDYAQQQYLPPQKRRSFVDAVVDAFRNGVHLKDLAKALITKFESLYKIREDDIEFYNNGLVEGEEFNLAVGDLDNTILRQIPIFYINEVDKGELLKDFSGAMQAFASTALNYEAMNKVKDVIEFMADYIKDQNLSASKGGLKQAEAIRDTAVHIFKNLVDLSKNTNTTRIIDGFVSQHLYGVKIKNPTKWTKLWRSLLMYNSIRNLSMNLKGIISNYVVGEIQMMIESFGHEFYNPVDYIWAHDKVFFANKGRRIVDYIVDDVNSKTVLLNNEFNPLVDNFREQGNKRYYHGIIRRMLGRDFTFLGYGIGEYIIHLVNMFAVLRHEKVFIDDGHGGTKKVSLYDIYSVGNKVDGNSELIRKDAKYINDEGQMVDVDDAYIDKIRNKILYVNQTTHGSMNEEDKGLVHQYMLGRFIMNLRQWMVEHYSRRYRKRYWDATLKEWREGYYRTANKFFLNWAKGLLHFQTDAALKWDSLDKGQRANVWRALGEQFILISLYGLNFVLGNPEDHEDEFWYRMWIYQVRRAIIDTKGSSPYGVPTEANTLINSPIAATQTINALLYPVTGLPDLFSGKEIQSGPHEGEYKYWRNIYKYWIPFTKQIEQMEEFGESESLFQIFEKDNL
ncbi:MAG: hypothetical protein IJU02_07060 [Lachnospiraceae bacterium]|nr:hypothetical protein [Lachnospiraceae bacterium]